APAPNVVGTLIAFAHVAGTSVAGPCCAGVASSGTGTSAITKTVAGLEHGDFLVDSSCAVWTQSAPPSTTPTPDLSVNTELVPRNAVLLASPDIVGMALTSGTSNIPAGTTAPKTLRWVLDGTRDWALSSLILLGQAPVDAGVPRDSAAAPPDGRTPDATPSDAVIPIDAPGDEVAPTDAMDAAPPSETAGPIDGGPTRPSVADGAVADGQPGKPIAVSLAVGCACRAGGAAPRGGLVVVLVAGLALRRRKRPPPGG